MHEKQVESSWWRSTCEKDVWGDPPWYILALVRLNYLVMVTVAIIAEWFRSHHLIQSPGPQELDKQKVSVLAFPFFSCSRVLQICLAEAHYYNVISYTCVRLCVRQVVSSLKLLKVKQ